MRELLNDILECIKFVSSDVTADLTEIKEEWNQCSQTHSGLLEKINETWSVSLETDFLDEYPDIRTKLAKKLEWLANDELNNLQSLIHRLAFLNENLKIKLDKINIRLGQISFEDYNEVEHSIREHVMWIENCWTCFHRLFLDIEFASMTVVMLGIKPACDLIDAIKQDEDDKLLISKSHSYMQSCLSLIKFVENKSKVNI